MGVNEIIYKGLKLSSTKCKYFQVKSGVTTSIVHNTSASTLELTYKPGNTSLSVSKLLGIEHIGDDQELSEMSSPIKFPSTTVTLNGLKFKKLTFDPHILRIVIVRDHESRVSQDYSHTTIVISEKDLGDREFLEYLLYSGGLSYIIPADRCLSCMPSWEWKNFPKIIIGDTSLVLTSTSSTIHSLRQDYDRYLIRSIDYQDQFIDEIKYRLDEYGVGLYRYNRETTVDKTSYCVYRFSQTPSKSNHPKYRDDGSGVIQNRVPIEFELRTTNMQLFHDFKNRYGNIDLLTNFCEFKTTDRNGERWSASVKWGRCTEDFNHLYEQDNNSNFSFQCQFTCELYFYEVYDLQSDFLKEIVIELTGSDVSGENPIKL